MKSFVALLILVSTTFSYAASQPMLRFWVGYAQERTHLDHFQEAVNRRLIPETIAVGAGLGLTGYLPAFPTRGAHDFLPDEIALIAYRDEAAYQAIRSTPRGALYGPLHFEPGLFAKATPEGWKSGSEVAVPFTGTVAANGAFVVGDAGVDWHQGYQRFSIFVRAKDTTAEQYRAAVATHLRGLRGRMSAVARVAPNYTLVLTHAENMRTLEGERRTVADSDPLQLVQRISVERQRYGQTDLFPGSAINVLFAR